jgi:glucoamylase
MSKAFGAPGTVDTWEHADKDAVGGAFHSGNRIWFTLWRGALTEVMYPIVDSAQIRNLRLAVCDGKSYVHLEDTDFESQLTRLGDHSQGCRFTARDRTGTYRYEKDVICDPELACVLQRYRVSPQSADGVRAYFICNPHLKDKEFGDGAKVALSQGHKILVAHNGDRWLAMGVSCGFSKASVGYAGASDGLTDLRENYRMDHEFTETEIPGNVLLTGEIPEGVHEFTVGLALGDTAHSALSHLCTSLSSPFEVQRRRYLDQWKTADSGIRDLAAWTGDGGVLYKISRNTIYTHEDRKYPGAIIASMATPWGEVKKAVTSSHAGYHLVWPRDAVHCASSLLAIGDAATPLRTLIYLSVSQRENGSFAQNFWIDGEPNMSSLQLDEVCYPILLAHRLHHENALLGFNPVPMVLKAAEYMIDRGPITPEERWEQLSGYSPSTLAVAISALICTAALARKAGKPRAAVFLEDYADWMRDHLEDWTVTTNGEAVPDCRRYLIRINPAQPGEADALPPNESILKMHNQAPGQPTHRPARNIVDTGFLELVRYGVYRPDDPLIVDSVHVIDRVLKVDTPFGPCWHRFSHDGYGQKPDGSPFKEWGVGRAWPLLTGERGHYELHAGRDPKPYIKTMEGLSGRTGLLDEQVWDRPFHVDGHDLFGCATGSARPLAWAHSEYLKLVRSAADRQVYDLLPEVAGRYGNPNRKRSRLIMWTKEYPTPAISRGETLRVFEHKPFRLRYTLDDWANLRDVPATTTEIDVQYVDVPVGPEQKAPIRFSFFWTEEGKWDKCDYAVAVK